MRNILITGGNQGIGLHMTKQFLHDGHRVAVLDLCATNLSTLESSNDRLQYHICDMRSDRAVRQAVSDIISEWDHIDIVIHNACTCTFDSLEETAIETYQNVFDINYFGAVRLTKAVLSQSKPTLPTKIIYTSSAVAIMGFKHLSPYSGSKNALESLAKCMNIEYASHGVRFQIMHPPLTQTASSSPLPIPKEMMKRPEEVGKALARRVHKNSFILCTGFGLRIQIALIYRFSAFFGRLFSKLTYSEPQANKTSSGDK